MAARENMKINLMFPGQGAQFTGMGLDFYKEYEEYRSLIEEASSVCDVDLLEILQDEERLSETENTQIAIFTMSYGIASLLRKEGVEADHALGLSLGEYGALTYGGALNPLDTLKILRRRSDLMQEAAQETRGFLAAVSFMDLAQVEEAVNKISGVTISNYNAPKQTVVGGEVEKKAEFEEGIRALGGKKITYLPVSGAFHTPLMKKAALRFQEYLKDFTLNDPEISVLSNYKGDFYERGEDYREILTKHIDHPVKLRDCLERLDSREEDVHILLGPGKALGSLVKQNRLKGRVYMINSVEDFKQTVKELKEKNNGK
ncbi:ACP S-malonyltransferase [Proteiniclasticum sp. C24MP]|uniref:ACP S-malonyltransferase n=1 Tax=Proteiniclasticum sp. C24MP TaxID=3374101 RepID=UPI0037550DD3